MYSFGSWVYSESTGIIYNNEMDDFALPYATDGLLLAEANYIKPGKSPMSSVRIRFNLIFNKLFFSH
jgi:gamma-glutamyltranspeptidase/glutathione hydrolase/leukotriene-C4 hydrolase